MNSLSDESQKMKTSLAIYNSIKLFKPYVIHIYQLIQSKDDSFKPTDHKDIEVDEDISALLIDNFVAFRKIIKTVFNSKVPLTKTLGRQITNSVSNMYKLDLLYGDYIVQFERNNDVAQTRDIAYFQQVITTFDYTYFTIGDDGVLGEMSARQTADEFARKYNISVNLSFIPQIFILVTFNNKIAVIEQLSICPRALIDLKDETLLYSTKLINTTLLSCAEDWVDARNVYILKSALNLFPKLKKKYKFDDTDVAQLKVNQKLFDVFEQQVVSTEEKDPFEDIEEEKETEMQTVVHKKNKKKKKGKDTSNAQSSKTEKHMEETDDNDETIARKMHEMELEQIKEERRESEELIARILSGQDNEIPETEDNKDEMTVLDILLKEPDIVEVLLQKIPSETLLSFFQSKVTSVPTHSDISELINRLPRLKEKTSDTDT